MKFCHKQAEKIEINKIQVEYTVDLPDFPELDVS